MLIIWTILMCTFYELTSSNLPKPKLSQGIFDISFDKMMASALGGEDQKDVYQHLSRRRDTRRAIVNNANEAENFFWDMLKRINFTANNNTITTEKALQVAQVTPLPVRMGDNITLEQIKWRMKQREIKRLLAEKSMSIPDFANDGDDPILLTRRFDKLQQLKPSDEYDKKKALRQFYHWQDVPSLVRVDKFKIFDMMQQFIYMIRYKMPIMMTIRKKYKDNLRYKMGYCFAMIALIKLQQKTLYSAAESFHKYATSVMTPMQFYLKVSRLAVDIDDIVNYLFRLNHQMNLLLDRNYYDSDSEEDDGID